MGSDSPADAMRFPFAGAMRATPAACEDDAVVDHEVDVSGSADGALPEDSPTLAERFFLRRLHRGDPRAFTELVHRHQDRVYSLTCRMLGDPQEAEDLAQDVFVSVHRHLPRFRGECRLSTWIYRITRNHCLNRLKRRVHEANAREAAFRDGGSGAEGFAVTRPPNPDQALVATEERVRVQAALERLEPTHRMLVVLRDLEGLSYEDLARIAELPVGTVKSRLHRARAALARVLEEEGMAPDGAKRANATCRGEEKK